MTPCWRGAVARGALVGWIAIGCATAPAERARVPDVSGTWAGTISPTGGILATMAGVGAGEMRLMLVQQGRGVSGEGILPGARITLSGMLWGSDLSASAVGQTGQGAGGVSVNLRIDGDRMEGFVEFSPVTLRRVR